MTMKPLPAREDLAVLLDYNPETGAFRWKHRPASIFTEGRYSAGRQAATWNGNFAGRPAFTATTANGHCYGSIWRSKFYAHRVAWKLVHGTDPDEIDHINGDPADNRIANLRSVTHSENGRNVKLPRDNSSGRIGIRWHEECGKWAAEIRANGRREYLGVHRTFEGAVAAREAAEARLGFHPNHGRKTKENHDGKC